MQVFRISKASYIEDLSGTGAKQYGGRWNISGRSVLYTSSSRALAMLEVLVHTESRFLPKDMVLATLELSLSIYYVLPDILPADWAHPLDHSSAQVFAESIYTDRSEALFGFPSVVMPEEYNFILLPDRVEQSVHLTAQRPLAWDERF